MPVDIQATSQLYWIAALITALVDLLLIWWLVRWLDKITFRQLQPGLTIASMVFWSVLYTWAANAFWNSCYQFLFPEWVPRIVFPFGVLVGLLGYLFWWISLRLPGNPLWWFILLGGFHSLLAHFPVIYIENILDNCPILVGVSSSSVLVFGIFEFIFYWCIILIISALVRNLSMHKRER